MMPVERPDWTNGEISSNLVVSDGANMLAEIEAEYPLDESGDFGELEDDHDALAGLSPGQLEAGEHVFGLLMADHPDPDGFGIMADALPAEVQRKWFDEMMARPNLRGERLTNALKGKLTLTEGCIFDDWLSLLEPMDRELFK